MSQADSDPENRLPNWLTKTRASLALSFVGLLLALHALAAPIFQPLTYVLVRDSPILVFYVLPTILIGIGTYAGLTYLGVERSGEYARTIVAALLLASVMVTGLSIVKTSEHLADRTVEKMEVQTLGEDTDSLPSIDAANMRNTPLKKARVDANNNYQQSKFKLSDKADITYVDGEPYWSFANIPDASGERWSGAQNGSTFVSQTDSDGQVYVVQGDVKNGLGVQPWRSNKWNLQRQNYWVQYEDPFMSVSELPSQGGAVEGETKIVRPLITHTYHFGSAPNAAGITIPFALFVFTAFWIGGHRLSRDRPVVVLGIFVGAALLAALVIPYAVPSFAGVALQEADGSVEYLSPEEVQQNEELSDDNVYPYDLAMEEVKSLNWRQGAINVYWSKNGLFKIAEPGIDYGNELPYTVQGADGSKDYYIPVSPQGSGDGLKHIFVMDGQTGELTQYKTGEVRMVGSQNIGNYVQGETPPQVTTWEEFQPVEPLPVVHDGHLFWQVRILPVEGTGMPGYAFINASQTDDIRFAMGDNKDELAKAFARGESITDRNEVTQNRTQTTVNGTAVTEIVVKKGGETVGRFTVTDNTTVEFNVQSANSTKTET